MSDRPEIESYRMEPHVITEYKISRDCDKKFNKFIYLFPEGHRSMWYNLQNI
jgi:hypothetical protein